MVNKVLATLSYEVGFMVGDTSTTFLARIKDFLNDRNDDAIFRSGATIWSIASTARLGDTDIPTLGLGEVIKVGAISDAYDAKRQPQKAAKFLQAYEYKLGSFIINQPWTLINASVGRYEAYD
jgi:hypothetical protein